MLKQQQPSYSVRPSATRVLRARNYSCHYDAIRCTIWAWGALQDATDARATMAECQDNCDLEIEWHNARLDMISANREYWDAMRGREVAIAEIRRGEFNPLIAY